MHLDIIVESRANTLSPLGVEVCEKELLLSVMRVRDSDNLLSFKLKSGKQKKNCEKKNCDKHDSVLPCCNSEVGLNATGHH